MKPENRLRKLLDSLHQGYYLEKHLIRDGNTHPVAIICPGGGYHWVCSFVEGLPFARKLNNMGYHAIVVHYRCGKDFPYPTPQDDLAQAIGEALRNQEKWKLDMENYSLWGSSAGGHLAASFGSDALGYKNYGLPKPGALVLIYPVITMGRYAHMGSRNYLLGPDPLPDLAELASVEKQITKDYPPTFLWCGLDDHTVDPENSRMLAASLARKGVPHQFLPIEGVDHGVGIGEGLPCEGWLEKAVAFWETHRSK